MTVTANCAVSLAMYGSDARTAMLYVELSPWSVLCCSVGVHVKRPAEALILAPSGTVPARLNATGCPSGSAAATSTLSSTLTPTVRLGSGAISGASLGRSSMPAEASEPGDPGPGRVRFAGSPTPRICAPFSCRAALPA